MRTLGLSFLTALAFGGATSQAADFGALTTHGADYPSVQALVRLGEVLGWQTGGRHRLGLMQKTVSTESFIIQQVRLGQVELAAVDIANFHDLLPSTRALSLPYLFKSDEQVARVLEGPVGQGILAEFNRLGLVAVCFFDAGERTMVSRKPIMEPNDLRGLRVATRDSELNKATLTALGAQPVVLPESGIHAALKAGVIDAAEIGLVDYLGGRSGAAAPFYVPTNHARAIEVVIMAPSLWRRLSEDDRAALRVAVGEAIALQRQVRRDAERNSLLTAASFGVELVPMVDHDAFARALQPVANLYSASAAVKPVAEQVAELPSGPQRFRLVSGAGMVAASEQVAGR